MLAVLMGARQNIDLTVHWKGERTSEDGKLWVRAVTLQFSEGLKYTALIPDSSAPVTNPLRIYGIQPQCLDLPDNILPLDVRVAKTMVCYIGVIAGNAFDSCRKVNVEFPKEFLKGRRYQLHVFSDKFKFKARLFAENEKKVFPQKTRVEQIAHVTSQIASHLKPLEYTVLTEMKPNQPHLFLMNEEGNCLMRDASNQRGFENAGFKYKEIPFVGFNEAGELLAKKEKD